METIEYRTMDKSGWSRGPWDNEPDKKQWRDEATGLPCLIVRNRFGNWCGYVGVAPGHPWHGVGYSDIIPGSKCTDECGDGYHYAHSTGAAIEVHGGLTFARGCADLSTEAYQKWLGLIEKSRDEARVYPRGDAAERIAEAAKIKSFGDWVERGKSQNICHIPGDGEPDNVWWFGFDCGHAGDWSPGMERYRTCGEDEYRDLAYIESEVARLAKQLAEQS